MKCKYEISNLFLFLGRVLRGAGSNSFRLVLNVFCYTSLFIIEYHFAEQVEPVVM